MLTALDHIIIGTIDLTQATRIFQDTLGLQPSGGGVHPTGGTANRIIVIGDTYLELITVQTPEEAQESMLYRLEQGDGYLNFVLASDDIVQDSQAMRARGVTIIGPNQGALQSAAGRSRGWLRTDVERPDLAQHYPFIIQHDSTGEERRHRLAGWQQPPVHPLGAQRIVSATIAVEDLDEATRRFEHIYGLKGTLKRPEEGWDARLVSFTLANGQRFELAASLTVPEEESKLAPVWLPQTGALAKHIQLFGESVCRMTIEVFSLKDARQYLETKGVSYRIQNKQQTQLWIDPEQTCGASIVLQESSSETQE